MCTSLMTKPSVFVFVLIYMFLFCSNRRSFATEITDVSWDGTMGVITITFDRFPRVWGEWNMYVDGIEVDMEGGSGRPVVRPNAPLDGNPTGLIVGTRPWVSGLEDVDFPCCGTIRFDIPGEGVTNEFEFNVTDFGCRTASSKQCPSEWTQHEGDVIIGDGETFTIENEKYIQRGNIYINGTGKMVVRNSTFMVGRGDVPTVHVYIFVDPQASLTIDKSVLKAASGLFCVMNYGTVTMSDSETSIHYFDVFNGARFVMSRSSMVSEIGGLLQMTGGSATLIDSTIGALALRVPNGSYLSVDGLESGGYFEY